MPNAALNGAENRLSRAYFMQRRELMREIRHYLIRVLSAMDLQRDEISLKQAEEEW